MTSWLRWQLRAVGALPALGVAVGLHQSLQGALKPHPKADEGHQCPCAWGSHAASINAFMCGGSFRTAGPCPVCCKCDTSAKGQESDSDTAHL